MQAENNQTPRLQTLTKPMQLSTDADERKQTPISTGVLDYFPLAIAAVAVCSKAGNDQHHPGTPLVWDKTKSTDHADCIGRHLIDRNSYDTDGLLHSAKLAWRALALLQLQLEQGIKLKCSTKDCGNEWNDQSNVGQSLVGGIEGIGQEQEMLASGYTPRQINNLKKGIHEYQSNCNQRLS